MTKRRARRNVKVPVPEAEDARADDLPMLTPPPEAWPAGKEAEGPPPQPPPPPAPPSVPAAEAPRHGRRRVPAGWCESTEPGKRGGFACPTCGCRHFHVVDTRSLGGDRIQRRRECRHCGRRITTSERVIG